MVLPQSVSIEHVCDVNDIYAGYVLPSTCRAAPNPPLSTDAEDIYPMWLPEREMV